MSLKDKWKSFGKNTGQAFKNFGQAMATTAKVAVGKEENIDENGNSKLKQSWSKTGKGFGTAGKSLGSAAKGTVEKPFEEKPEKKEEKDDSKVVDVQDID